MGWLGLGFWKRRQILAQEDIDETTFLNALHENSLRRIAAVDFNAVSIAPTGLSLLWTFSDEVDATAIAAGDVRLNNATAASATTIYIHETGNGTVAAANFLALLVKGSQIVLRKRFGDSTQLQAYTVASNTDSGAYRTLVVTHAFGNGAFVDGDEVTATLLLAKLPALAADNVTKTLRSVNGVLAFDGVDFDKAAITGYNAEATQTLRNVAGTLTFGAESFDKTAIAGYDAGETQTLKHVEGVLTWVTDA